MFVFVLSKNIDMYTFNQKERLNNWWPLIPPISTKRRITFHQLTEHIEDHDMWRWKVMKGHVYIQCMWLLGNTYIVFNVMNYLPIKHQWLSNKQLSFKLGVISPLRCTSLSKGYTLIVRVEYNSTINSPCDFFSLQQNGITEDY